jgi:hypothetical protein
MHDDILVVEVTTVGEKEEKNVKDRGIKERQRLMKDEKGRNKKE